MDGAKLLIRGSPAIAIGVDVHVPRDKSRAAEPTFPRTAFRGWRQPRPFHGDENRFHRPGRNLGGQATDVDPEPECFSGDL